MTPPASISRLFFLVVLLVSIYLTPRVMYILAPPFSLEISPRLSLSLSLSFSFFLLTWPLYLPLFLSLRRTPGSTYSPCRARLLLSLGNPPDTGQAGHVNASSANRAPGDVTRVGSLIRFGKEVAGVRVHLRTPRGRGDVPRTGGRDGWPVGSIYGRRVMQRRGGTDDFQDLAERIKAPSRQFVSSNFALTTFFYGEISLSRNTAKLLTDCSVLEPLFARNYIILI